MKTQNLNQNQLFNRVILFNRFSLFVVFFWFGFLKVISVSPAEGLVTHLHNETLARFIPSEQFVILLGIFECLIGILWLVPKLTKWAFYLFSIQMFTTFLPLLYLPSDTWQNSFVLTLTGQYIVKNLVLIGSALFILLDYIAQQNKSTLTQNNRSADPDFSEPAMAYQMQALQHAEK